MIRFLCVVSIALTTARVQAEAEPPSPAPTDKGLVITRSGPRSYNIEAPGNLGPNQPFTGRTLAEIGPEHNPVDLLSQAMTLARQDRKAAYQLLMAASLRGAFDQKRVEDPTAHGAWAYLLSQTGPSQLRYWGTLSSRVGQAEFQAVVAWARASGPPTYHPRWMIQHGLRTLDGDQAKAGGGLKPAFDAAKAWTEVCDQLGRTTDDETYWSTRAKLTNPEALQASLRFLAQAAEGNLTTFSSETADATRAKLREAGARFDPRSDDPAWQFVEAKAALSRIFQEGAAEDFKARAEAEKKKAAK
jgi:hypothetical protein